MKKLLKSIVVLLSIALLFFAACSLDISSKHGLYVEDGKLLRQGHEFRAMGINYFNSLTDYLEDESKVHFIEGFKTIKEKYNIPFIRLMGGPYGHNGWKLYVENPDEYLKRFDFLVSVAEQEGLGLIPSLFWYVATMPDLAGEPLSALGDKDSECRKLMRKYIRDVVGRYKDSPAIWGWEVGNEWMLHADLPKYDHLPPKKIGSKEERGKADKLLRPMILDAYVDFYQTVRKYDPYRIVVTGDSIARGQAWHNRNEDIWGQDTREQWFEIFEGDTPACYEVSTFHLYAEAEKGYFEQKDLPIESFVGEVVDFCHKNKKIVWCGELGMPNTGKETKDMFFRMMNAVESSEIEISAIWNFMPLGKAQADWDISPNNERAYMLDAVKALNERFAKGKWK